MGAINASIDSRTTRVSDFLVQPLFTPTYLRSQSNLLQLWALFLGGVAIVLWITLRMYEANRLQRAERYAKAGRHQEALKLFLEAEYAWNLNEVHKTPKTTLKCLKHFLQLLSQIEAETNKLRLTISTKPLKAVVRDLILIYQNPKSYGFDRFHLKSSVEERVSHLSVRFAKLRRQFEQESEKLISSL